MSCRVGVHDTSFARILSKGCQDPLGVSSPDWWEWGYEGVMVGTQPLGLWFCDSCPSVSMLPSALRTLQTVQQAYISPEQSWLTPQGHSYEGNKWTHHHIPGTELPLWRPVELRGCGRQQIGCVVQRSETEALQGFSG